MSAERSATSNVGGRIRLIRLARGYTIADLGRRSRVSTAYVSLIERGVMNPNAE
jgi:transcriptional regulator with XRE-family HTH domain